MEFCKKCGSVKINGKCSNTKKCINSVGFKPLSTFRQNEEIKRLCGVLKLDEDDYLKKNLTKERAIGIISKLKEKEKDGCYR